MSALIASKLLIVASGRVQTGSYHDDPWDESHTKLETCNEDRKYKYRPYMYGHVSIACDVLSDSQY